MEIVDSRFDNNRVPLESLHAGACFYTQDHSLYLISDERTSSTVHCINLKTGDVSNMRSDLIVEKVKGKVVILK